MVNYYHEYYVLIRLDQQVCPPRFDGPELFSSIFRSASVQGRSTFLITGGYDMKYGRLGTKLRDILYFRGTDDIGAGWWDATAAASDGPKMRHPRGGHVAVLLRWSQEHQPSCE